MNPTIAQLFDLSGKVFLVTGGARNLGNDMACALAEAGADGVLTSRSAADAEEAAQKLSDQTGRRVVGLALDVTGEAAVQSVVAQVQQLFGSLDILVNNAGGGGTMMKGAPADLEARPREAWDTTFAGNMTSVFMVCKHVVPIMKEQGSGSIINIASIAGIVGRDRSVYVEGMSAQTLDYAAAKAAVIGFTRDLAGYLSGTGIRVNAISPGGFGRGQVAGFVERYNAKTPLGRMGQDGVDLKGATVFLASEAAAYVHGHNLVVDGGFSVWQ